jgi:hypothetical protein
MALHGYENTRGWRCCEKFKARYTIPADTHPVDLRILSGTPEIAAAQSDDTAAAHDAKVKIQWTAAWPSPHYSPGK